MALSRKSNYIAALLVAGLLAAPLGAVPTLVTSQATPATAIVGQPLAPITFGVTELAAHGSWRVSGTLPPGTKLSAREKPAAELTAPGTLDATEMSSADDYGYVITQGNSMTTPQLTGTPTQAGSYTFTLQAFQLGGLGGTSSPVFSYTVNVVAASSGDVGGTVPVFTRHPASQMVAAAGSTVVFSAEATGGGLYQWQKDGVPLADATRASLVLTNVTTASAGSYAVRASNASGAILSNVGALTVSADSNFGHLINLSIRTHITGTDPLFTIGTTVGGGAAGATKPLLLRAVGPTLAGFGLSAAIADSKLEVFSGATMVAANDNWDGAAALGSVFAQVGAFPFAGAASRDAAVFNPSMAAGSYTVQVSGVAGATGEVLAELYDASTSFGAATPRLTNVSVRKQIEANGSLTAGFVIGGATARTVLVRAIGPGLGVFGLTGFMVDPQLSLFSGQTKLAENDNWGGDPQLTDAGGSVGAFALANAASRDAMLLMTLAPGNYTVQISGAGGVGGEALVEVYEVP